LKKSSKNFLGDFFYISISSNICQCLFWYRNILYYVFNFGLIR